MDDFTLLKSLGIDQLAQSDVAEGQLLWIIGPKLHLLLESLLGSEPSVRRLRLWETHNKFLYQLSSYSDISELQTALLKVARAALVEALFEPARKAKSLARDLHEVIKALTAAPLPDRYVLQALYYREQRFADEYEMLADSAGHLPEFGSAAAFKQAIENQVEWMSLARLNELNVGRPRNPVAGQSKKLAVSPKTELLSFAEQIGRGSTSFESVRPGFKYTITDESSSLASRAAFSQRYNPFFHQEAEARK
ncbi:hypothetical protein [Arthrobacter zhaoguopingii]|uniref:hypothetical protein n=1 Tax=Arthrobacter zhaoguopingii TaxID=2681491 RepID=UPI0013586825|nr:hypothetical protein [Arthrobacter zhaoguopingii]